MNGQEASEIWDLALNLAERGLDADDTARMFVAQANALRVLIEGPKDEKVRAIMVELWGDALHHLSAMHAATLGIAGTLRDITASNDSTETHRVIEFLALRGCDTASEIMTLIAAGRPMGAWARWRTLFEMRVAAAFIAKYQEDAANAWLRDQESLLAEVIKAMDRSDHPQRPSADERLDAESRLAAQTGLADFEKYNWGWTHRVLIDHDPKYAETIERLRRREKPIWTPDCLQTANRVGAGHRGTEYKMANQAVHASRADNLPIWRGAPGEFSGRVFLGHSIPGSCAGEDLFVLATISAGCSGRWEQYEPGVHLLRDLADRTMVAFDQAEARAKCVGDSLLGA